MSEKFCGSCRRLSMRPRPLTRAAVDMDAYRRHPQNFCLYLASISPRRRSLLKKEKIKFKIIRPNYHEKPIRGAGPVRLVTTHALQKALSVASKVKKGVIISADTIVYFKGKVIGKPKNLKDAFGILSRLQGNWHTVFTGVALLKIKCGKVINRENFYEKSLVKIKKMSVSEIKSYFKHTNPLDKAGAYAIQSKNATIVEQIKGSFSNAVGLPMEKLCDRLNVI